MNLKRGALACVILGAMVLPLSFSASTQAQAGILEFLFPTMAKKEPDLSQTLQAPFADIPASDDGAQRTENYLPENAVPIDKPHRQVPHISEYVSEVVSKALLYQEDDYRLEYAEILKDFDALGQQEYNNFLIEKNILKVLKSGRYFVRSFVSDVPLLLNAGPVDGRYRWLFEVPVMVSYMERGKDGYNDGAKPTNQKIVIRLQVGRQKDVQNKTGVMIEKWSGKVRKIDKK